MAPKRQQPPVEDPPSASSSEEEEEEETSSGEEEEESDDDSKKQKPKPSSPSLTPSPQAKTTTPTQTSKKPDQPHSESESESGSETESESEAELGQNIKPIASKPMEGTQPKTAAAATKNARSRASVTSTPEKSAAKRGNETDRDSKDAKRAKNKEVDLEKSEDAKKHLFQRLWTEEDEIVVLKGIIEFTEEKGYDPLKDMTAFFDFVKKSLHFDVSYTQFRDKIFRLKKKFENHVKGKKGEDKTFSKSHDQKTFDLSKKIWGSEGISGGGAESSLKANGNLSYNKRRNAKKFAALKTELGMDVGKEEDGMEIEFERSAVGEDSLKFDRALDMGMMEDYIVKRGLDFVEGAKKAEMEEEWRKLHVAELELFLRRNELIREQATLILAAFKSKEG